jgi:hypothetical protein
VLGGFPWSGLRLLNTFLAGRTARAAPASAVFFLPPRLCAGVVTLFWSSFGDGLVAVRFCRGVRRCTGRVEAVAGRSLVVLSGLCGGFMAEEWNDGTASIGRE